MELFRRSEDLTVPHTASKISNGVGLAISDLGAEPAKGLMRVVDHVQGSVPVLLQTHADVRSAHAQVKAVLEEARDARDGVASAVGAVGAAARERLAESLALLAAVGPEGERGGGGGKEAGR
ncbi:hypothetical protein Rsub_07377 [Raphidocelis subcapitata]|uniref:Uncharacterized protein n=1 Tax=Raphidocelis subcapitata TaxID=307507 RepID=A0A2V0P442_9CHLO|nr:hypothetical protein Rsub_07377 [Raphidocelis subcapitata]|eukprot:GBF94641.1 hypothetical protein Rsub_07377 [Raphidocelis subcapitata]